MFVPGSHARVQFLLDAGISVAEVARRTGVPYNVVRQHRDRRRAADKRSQDGAEDAAVDATRLRASTGDEIERLLTAGHTRADIARRLDVSRGTVTYHARRLGMPVDKRAARRYDWKVVQAYYDAGHTVLDCVAHFGFCSATWSSAVRRGNVVARPTAMPIEELLQRSRNRTNLKSRLLKAGLLSERCGECGITHWRARPLPLELHHINGDGKDNRLENLTLLCPNCHSQTDSWGGRNSGRGPALRSAPAARRARSRR
jgi:DNA-binding transcriptional ArsR family regulator